MFSDFFFKSSYFCAGVIKIRRRVFVFCGDDFFFNVRKLMSLIARVLQLIDFQTLPVEWQAKTLCHWYHFSQFLWHQWHAKNKHITRGIVDIQRFMTSVQWVQWDWESKQNDYLLSPINNLPNTEQFHFKYQRGETRNTGTSFRAITHFGWDIDYPFITYMHLLESDLPTIDDIAKAEGFGAITLVGIVKLLAID